MPAERKEISRRVFLIRSTRCAAGIFTAAVFTSCNTKRTTSKPGLPPVRAITRGPKFHWFGYYDKLQFDPAQRYVLGMEVDFEHRSPEPDDVIRIGMVDLQDNDRWIELGDSRAWGWQQGCMLQWRPGSRSEILWNDREGDSFVCRILDIDTGNKRTLPLPIYALSPDGRTAVCADFARINNMRPGYGYAGGADPYAEVKAPENAGIHRMDLDSGEHELIVSLSDVAKIPHLGDSVDDKWHYFNHLLISPDSTRFIFLNRYREYPITAEMRKEENFYSKYVSGQYVTRMFTAGLDGSDRYVLDPGHTSHFIWRDAQHVCAWTSGVDREKGFYLFEDRTRNVKPVGEGVMTRNGHLTYLPLPGNEWVLNDTYPDQQRNQNPYLYHIKTGRKVPLGHFYQPPEYKGEWRCDTHPRYSPDGTMVVIDSTHGGNGRQMYLIDIGELI